MFFTGIFTTHLPYIVMVMFYAYSLIFGIEKTTKDEVVSDSFIKIEIETAGFHIDTGEVCNYYSHKDFNVFKAAFFEDFAIKSRLKHPNYLYSIYEQNNYSYSQFSRPPPKA